MISELGTRTNDLSRFSADFREDKVYIGKRVFPAGYFMIPLLNNDHGIVSMFGAYANDLWTLIEQLERGSIRKKDFENARETAHEMCALVQKMEPFCYLNDSYYEDGKIDFFLRDSQFRSLQKYFHLMAEQYKENRLYRYLSEDEKYILNEGKYFYEQLMQMLKFYALLFWDGAMMYHLGNALMESLEGELKLDEQTLITKVCELFPMPYSYIANENEHGKRESHRVNRADVEYIALQVPNSQKIVTARRIFFDRWIDFLVADFFEGIRYKHYPKKCAVCGKYFLIENGHNRKYCDGIDPNDAKGRSCRQVGADRNRRQRENPKVHPIKEACRTRINTIDQHKYRGKITKEFADTAKKLARDRRDRAVMDPIYAAKQYSKDISQKAIYSAAEKILKQN